MVMEKPSPLLVGREFVRQYYTLLNKAPDFLHRYTSENVFISSLCLMTIGRYFKKTFKIVNSDFTGEIHPMSMVVWIRMDSYQRQSMGKL